MSPYYLKPHYPIAKLVADQVRAFEPEQWVVVGFFDFCGEAERIEAEWIEADKSQISQPMTREEAIEKLKAIFERGIDAEKDHSDADAVLCEFLRSNDYGDIVDRYDMIFKL